MLLGAISVTNISVFSALYLSAAIYYFHQRRAFIHSNPPPTSDAQRNLLKNRICYNFWRGGASKEFPIATRRPEQFFSVPPNTATGNIHYKTNARESPPKHRKMRPRSITLLAAVFHIATHCPSAIGSSEFTPLRSDRPQSATHHIMSRTPLITYTRRNELRNIPKTECENRCMELAISDMRITQCFS